MNEADARSHLVDVLATALNDKVNFVSMGQLFPSETREQSVAALKRLGYQSAADLLDSITGEHSLHRLWD